METDLRTIMSLLPEITLSTAAVLIIVAAAFFRSATAWITLAATAFVAAGIVLFRQYGPPNSEAVALATGSFWFDPMSGTWRWAALGFGIVLLFAMTKTASCDRGGEHVGMLMLIIAGLMLAVSSSNLVFMFLSLEMISIPTYVLLFLGRNGSGAIEAAAKYFFLGILSSAFFLMGLAVLYGATGSMSLPQVSLGMQSGDAASLTSVALVAVVFILAGIGFKIAAVPFHFYAPDVYLATTNTNAGLLAVIPKVAGFVVLIRLIPIFGPVFPDFNYKLAIILSLITMTVGNIGALLQTNFRRMMAFSSIAHTGYMLIGVAVGLSGASAAVAYDGFSAAQFYLLIYGIASLGAFGVMCEVQSSEAAAGSIGELRGLARRRPWMAGALAICMFSLAGLPPIAGFWGKLTLFSAALTAHQQLSGSSWFLLLAVVGVLNAAVAAAYYLRVIGAVYFDDSPAESGDRPAVGLAALGAIMCGILVVTAGLMPGGLMNYFQQSKIHTPPTTHVADDLRMTPAAARR